MMARKTVGAVEATTNIGHRIQTGIRVALPIFGLALLTWSMLWPRTLPAHSQSFMSGIGAGMLVASLFVWIMVWRRRRGRDSDLADSVLGPLDERVGMIVRSALALMGVVALISTLVAVCLIAFTRADPEDVVAVLLWAQLLAYMIGFVWFSRHH